MRSYHEIQGRDVPEWYRLGIVPGTTTIVIQAHPCTLDVLHTVASGRAAHRYDELQLPAFIPPQESVWGFGPVLHRMDDQGRWVTWHCPMPNPTDGEWPDSTPGLAVAASLALLFVGLNCSTVETESMMPQQLVISGMRVELGMCGGGAINAALSRSMVLWLEQQSTGTLGDVTRVLLRFASQLWPHAPIESSRCAMLDPGLVYLDCPGISSGLDPEDRAEHNRGYELVPHNTDHWIQQLVLLGGLAALCQVARGEQV